MTQFAMVSDVRGFNSFGLEPSSDKFATTLAVGVAQTFTTPTAYDRYVAIFSVEPGASVWFAHKTTATLPGSSVAAATSELNPTVWKVSAGDTISAISPNTTAQVGVKFYGI